MRFSIKISHKLLLSSLTFAVPLTLLVYFMVSGINDDIQFARMESWGNQVLQPLSSLLHLIPRYQLRMALRQAGDSSLERELSANTEQIQAAFEDLEQKTATFGRALQIDADGLRRVTLESLQASALIEQWNAVQSSWSTPGGEPLEPSSSALLQNIRGLISRVGDTSKLILDPDLDSYYLMDVVLLAMPQMHHRVSTMLAEGRQKLQRFPRGEAERIFFGVQADLFKEADVARIQQAIGTALREDRNFYGLSPSLQEHLPPALDRYTEAAAALLTALDELAGSNEQTLTVSEFAALGENVLRSGAELWAISRQELNGLLDRRIRSYQDIRMLYSALSFAAVALAGVFVFLIAVGITRGITNVVRITEQIARGELAVIAADPSAKDEIGLLMNALAYMRTRIGAVLQEMTVVSQAIQLGQLTTRGTTDAFTGSWCDLVYGMNRVVDAFMAPFKTTAAYIERISKGDLPDEITDTYQGDFNDLKNNVNLLLSSTRAVTTLAQEIAGGNLAVNVTPRSNADTLMQTLQQMVAYLQDVGNVTERISHKDLHVQVVPKSDQDALNLSLQRMVTTLQTMMAEIDHSMTEIKRQSWTRTGQVELGNVMRGEQDIPTLARNVIAYLVKYLNASVGTLYLMDEDNSWLQLVGSYAHTTRKGNRNRLKIGEGIVGQVALEQQPVVFTDLPEQYLSILGDTPPATILVAPFIYEGNVKGVVELGALKRFTKFQQHFLEQITENVAITFHSAQTRRKMQELLEATRKQAKELQTQQEELRAVNEELEGQAAHLRASEQKLQQQQEELRQTNEELAEQTRALEQQQRDVRENNLDLENARHLVE